MIFLLLLLLPLSLFSKDLKTCVYVNSYHVDFPWSKVISKEIKNILKYSCEVIELIDTPMQSKGVSVGRF
jgi:hypothetical protein